MSEQQGGIPPHPPGDNPQNGQVPVEALVAPRPLPAAYKMRVIEFDTPEGHKALVELTFLTATGQFVTFWDPTSCRRLGADIRGAGSEAGQKESGLHIARQMPPEPPPTTKR